MSPLPSELRYRNTSGSFGEREMLWEHEPTGNFHCFYEFLQTFKSASIHELNRNTENVFSISFRKFCDEKKKTLITFINKM